MKLLPTYFTNALKHAEHLYPLVYRRLEKFSDFYRNIGTSYFYEDDFNQAYSCLKNDLYEITNVDWQDFDLLKEWDDDGDEVLALVLSLPPPENVVLSKGELATCVDYLLDCNNYFDKNLQPFEYYFGYHFSYYVRTVLKLSFPNGYDGDYFNAHDFQSSGLPLYSKQQITDAIFSNQPIQQVKK